MKPGPLKRTPNFAKDGRCNETQRQIDRFINFKDRPGRQLVYKDKQPRMYLGEADWLVT